MEKMELHGGNLREGRRTHSGQQELEVTSNDSGVMNVILAGVREHAEKSPQKIQLDNNYGA